MPKRKRRSSVFKKRKSFKRRGRRIVKAKLRGTTRSIATRALALAKVASSTIESKHIRYVTPSSVTCTFPGTSATYVACPTEISTGVSDVGVSGAAQRVGNEISATGLKINYRVQMQHNAGAAGTLSTWNGEQRVRVIVGIHSGKGNNTNSRPSRINTTNNYPQCFYPTTDWEQEHAAWGRFPKYRKSLHTAGLAEGVAEFKVLYQKELVFNSFTVRNSGPTSNDISLGQDGINVNDMGGLPQRKVYSDYQTVEKFIKLNHKVRYNGDASTACTAGTIGIFICQHDNVTEYGTGNLKYFGDCTLYYKDA